MVRELKVEASQTFAALREDAQANKAKQKASGEAIASRFDGIYRKAV